MLRISRLTDYGLVISGRLAEVDRLASVSSLALETKIPAPTISKVLKQLVHARLVESVRGVHGGYRLARKPEAIRVDEIIAAIDGPIAVTECSESEDHSNCELESNCDLSSNWKKINHAVQQALAKITLADMMSQQQPKLISIQSLLSERAHKQPRTGT